MNLLIKVFEITSIFHLTFISTPFPSAGIIFSVDFDFKMTAFISRC